MQEFHLPDMTCGHCVATITKTVQALDPQAQIQTDLPTHQVRIDTQTSRDALIASLTEAGYPQGFGITLHGPNDRYVNDASIVESVAQMSGQSGEDFTS